MSILCEICESTDPVTGNVSPVSALINPGYLNSVLGLSTKSLHPAQINPEVADYVSMQLMHANLYDVIHSMLCNATYVDAVHTKEKDAVASLECIYFSC